MENTIIEIVSGTPENKESTRKFFEELIFNKKGKIIIFPERNENLYHPKDLYEYIQKLTEDSIKNNENLFILTYSTHVLNGARVVIKKYNYECGKVHQITKKGKDAESKITKFGKLSYWAKDVFDTDEKELLELM